MASVKIGPSFFKNVLRDYRDWHFAIIREFAQNSIDASSTKIDVTIDLVNGNTFLTFANNGYPMTKDILVDKLLSIGETGKNFNDSIGGFGRAKEILLFCHEEYHIRTGEYIVDGSGGEYDIKSAEHYDGTSTSIIINGDHYDALLDACKTFAFYSQWKGDFNVNGERFDVCMRKGSRRRDVRSGTVYTNNSDRNVLVVRMRGILMFKRYVNLDKCVVLELNEPSGEYLQSNRDGLKYGYASEVDTFVDSLSVNKRALDEHVVETLVFEGDKLNVDESEVVVGDVRLSVSMILDKSEGNISDNEMITMIRETSLNVLDYGFIIHNETGMRIPDYFLPDSDQFCAYARKVSRIWSNMLLTLYTIHNIRSEFMVGFVFSDTNCDGERTEALHMNKDGCDIYLINPVKIVKQVYSNSRSMKNCLSLVDFGLFVSLAAHEFVHGAFDLDCHNESYASKLTDVMATVCKNIKLFKGCMR